jgi:hypothetical protein
MAFVISCESVNNVTLLHLVFNADNACIIAISSILLLVVILYPPDISLVFPSVDSIAAQPPFPGLPNELPSV